MSNNKIPTGLRFTAKQIAIESKSFSSIEEIENYILEHTKFYVEAALKAAAEEAKWYSEDEEISFGHMGDFDFKDTDGAGDPCRGYTIHINKKSILNAYPLTNIK